MLGSYWGYLTLSIAVATTFFTVIGYAMSRRVLRDCPDLVCWLLSPLLGLSVWTGASVAVFHYLPFNRGSISAIAGAAFVVGIAIGRRTGVHGFRAAAPLFAWSSAIALLPLLMITPSERNQGLFFAVPIFDHMKVALVDAIFRLGLPPVSPFYAIDGEPVPLNYYYGWYVVAAMLRAIPGVSGLVAEAAMTHVTAFASVLALAGLAFFISNRTRAAYIAIAVAIPLGLHEALGWIGGDPYWDFIGGDHGFEGWLMQAAWCPQHLFAGATVVLASFLLVQLIFVMPSRWPTALLLGLMISGAVVSSVWAGACALLALSGFVLFSLLITRDAVRRVSTWIGPLLTAVLVSAVTSLPVLLNLWRLNREIPRAPVEFWVYPAIEAFVGYELSSYAKNIAAYWTIYLTIQFGAAYIAGWFGLLAYRKGSFRVTLFRRVAIAVVVGDLLVAEFFHSVIVNNDMGWRVVIPPLLLLIVWTAVAADGWFEALRWSRMGELPRGALAGLSVLVVLATLGLGFSGRFLLERFGTIALSRYQAALLHEFRHQPRAWERVRALTSPRDIVAVNPKSFERVTEWPANAPVSLFADRNTLLSDSDMPLVFSQQVDHWRFQKDFDFLKEFFNGRPSQRDVQRLAIDLRAHALLVTRRDALWRNGVLKETLYYRLAAESPYYRVYLRRWGAADRVQSVMRYPQ